MSSIMMQIHMKSVYHSTSTKIFIITSAPENWIHADGVKIGLNTLKDSSTFPTKIELAHFL